MKINMHNYKEKPYELNSLRVLDLYGAAIKCSEEKGLKDEKFMSNVLECFENALYHWGFNACREANLNGDKSAGLTVNARKLLDFISQKFCGDNRYYLTFISGWEDFYEVNEGKVLHKELVEH